MANQTNNNKSERHQITARIDRYQELKEIAEEKKWSFNTALNDAVEFYLTDHNKKKVEIDDGFNDE